MNINFFESTLQYDWDMSPTNRTFDPIKVKQYLSLMDENDSDFIKDLLDNTIYISYKTFRISMLKSLKMFQEEINKNPFYLLLPDDKIGSEHWITAILWPLLRDMNLIEIINQKHGLILQNPINILIIDDAIYSGQNTINKIEAIIFAAALANPKIGFMNAGKYFKFHIVTPYTTKSGGDKLIKIFNQFKSDYVLYETNDLPLLPELVDIKKYYPINTEKTLQTRFDIWSPNMPPIYFDHKVAGPLSTFSSIYSRGKLPDGSSFGSLFTVNPSRYKIEELAELYKDWVKK